MGVSGAVIPITARQQTGNGSQVFLGDMLILINAVAYTIYFVIVKPLMLTYNLVQVIRWVFTYGFLWCCLLVGLNLLQSIGERLEQ